MIQDRRFANSQIRDGMSPDLYREIGFADEFPVWPGDRSSELLQEKMQPVDAVSTGFSTWSRCCRDAGGGQGLARGWHAVVSGRSGFGKSAFALNVAMEAFRAGERVCYCSFEMSGTQVETRALAIVSGIPIAKLEQGRSFDCAAYHDATAELEDISAHTAGLFHVNRRPLRDLDELLHAMSWANDKLGCRFFVTDYLQLAASDPNDAACITKVSHEVRRAAQQLDVVSLAVSQFNRLTSASDAPPTMFGLMGGSALENDSDQVLLLDHSRKQPAPAPLDAWNGYLLLAKNRHGPTGEIPIQFNRRTLRITERLPDED